MAHRGDSLSETERRVVSMLADGVKPEQIAGRLGCGVWTVRTHIYRARQKLGADSMLRLAVLFDRSRR